MESPFNKEKRKQIISGLKEQLVLLDERFKIVVKQKHGYNELKEIMAKQHELKEEIINMERQNENE
jgi:hypothetical protein